MLDAAAAAAGPGGGEAHAGGAPRPAWCWSDHTLPVTCLAVAAGGGEAAAVVVSGSADRTLKLRRLADGRLLAAVALPSPVNALQLDAGEGVVALACVVHGTYSQAGCVAVQGAVACCGMRHWCWRHSVVVRAATGGLYRRPTTLGTLGTDTSRQGD